MSLGHKIGSATTRLDQACVSWVLRIIRVECILVKRFYCPVCPGESERKSYPRAQRG